MSMISMQLSVGGSMISMMTAMEMVLMNVHAFGFQVVIPSLMIRLGLTAEEQVMAQD